MIGQFSETIMLDHVGLGPKSYDRILRKFQKRVPTIIVAAFMDRYLRYPPDLEIERWEMIKQAVVLNCIPPPFGDSHN